MTGILCIDKPAGITSFGVVAKVRGITGEKKCGHTGTLDPMATGVLPILLGGATRFLDYLPDSDKGYRAGFILGKTTDTLDITGTVLSESPVTASPQDIIELLPSFTGTIQQVPPMYSAKSVGGRRLYELARQGIETEREACTVEIHALTYCGCENGEHIIDVRCSKGTYIRSLIDDIGKRLGCGAVMTSLRRTLAAGFTEEQCVTLETLQERKDTDSGFDGLIVGLDTVFRSYPSVYVSEAQAKRLRNGAPLDIARIRKPPAEGVTVCARYADALLGLARREGDELKGVRMIGK